MIRLRIYFHSLADAPKIWSYNLGTQETEVHIAGFQTNGCAITAGQDLSVPMGDKDRPRVWMEIAHADHFDVIDDVLHVYGR